MLITQCKVLCHPPHISIKSEGRESSSVTKKDMLGYVKTNSKGSEIYCFSRSASPNFNPRPNMVANVFEDFQPPSKNS